MAARRNHPYRHRGVHIPFVDAGPNNQWSLNDSIQADGFIFCTEFKKNLYLVQSVRTGDLYVNKILERDEDGNLNDEVEELRISTAPHAKGRLIGPQLVRQMWRTYFNELELWQNIADGTSSLYLRFYNGGDLEQLTEHYMEKKRPVPEHFVWHVFLTLIEAVRYLQTGALPGTDDEVANWIPIYNRDIAGNNLFIHYPERNNLEPEPPEGFQTNAFPEVVLGDFGHGALRGDRPEGIAGGRFNEFESAESWHDTYAIFCVIQEMCIAHVPYSVYLGSPGNVECSTINDHIAPGETPYSEDLINTLKLWEFPNRDRLMINESQPDQNGQLVHNSTLVPDLRRIIDEILPLARRMVRKYRRPGGVMPDDWYRQLDVSWTRPKRPMPAAGGNGNSSDENGDSRDHDGDKNGEGGNQQSSDNQEDDSDSIKKDGGDAGEDGDAGGNGDAGEDEDEEEDEEEEEDSGDFVEPPAPVIHKCPEPNPETNRTKLDGLVRLSNEFPDFRPEYRLVILEYQAPVMLDIRSIPPPPGPNVPESPPPTPPRTQRGRGRGRGGRGGGGRGGRAGRGVRGGVSKRASPSALEKRNLPRAGRFEGSYPA
ncbi:hypothetical protein F5Y14DRAFT_466257 [Nemania sp. NC0429]|nr:hypothetical protein F5Y14DRAFT_466257 [Nemania sp. NC0429]